MQKFKLIKNYNIIHDKINLYFVLQKDSYLIEDFTFICQKIILKLNSKRKFLVISNRFF
jgi:hypothetical protein